jgi:hypothetical protein
MFYSFARVSAVLKLKVDDYYHNGARRRLRLHEKGGKEHDMLVHHLLEQILNEYIEAAGLQSGQSGGLFSPPSDVTLGEQPASPFTWKRRPAGARPADVRCLQPAVEVPKHAELQSARAYGVALVVQLLCIGP